MELVDRLLTRQKAIEQTLAQRHLKEGHLVLYDITRPAVATSGIPVVGLGGSAGALDPLKAFFGGSSDSGASFIVIQHLAPAHKSLLTELLAPHTRMKIVQAEDGEPVEPNCVVPPNWNLGIRDGVLYLAEPVEQGSIGMPISTSSFAPWPRTGRNGRFACSFPGPGRMERLACGRCEGPAG